MKRMRKTWLAMTLAVCLLASLAMADTISFSGTVEPSETRTVYAPTGVTIESVPVKTGQAVTADTAIATIKTTKVYAPEDGTITAVFGQVGDEVTDVVNQYGAVMYLEGQYTLSVTASTSKAYEAKENYIVHPGEEVYLVSRERTSDKGTGLVTTVDSTAFTVLVTSGDFFVGDNIVVCREPNMSITSRIGRGDASRIAPTAVTGSGAIVSYAVKAGDTVQRGQLLFETVQGDFDSPELARAEIRAGVDGVVASLSVSQGSTLSQSGLVAEIYPKNAVWVVAKVSETDLKELSLGEKVKVELDWNQDQEISYDGTVEMISALGTVGEENTTYPVYITFTPDENTRYSMTALVTTLEEKTEAEAGDVEEAEDREPEADEEANAEEDAAGEPGAVDREGSRGGRRRFGDGEMPEMPEGGFPWGDMSEMPEDGFPESEMPEMTEDDSEDEEDGQSPDAGSGD